jgi:hypothetical protein
LCASLTDSIQPAIDKIRSPILVLGPTVVDRVVCEATLESLSTTITTATDSFIGSRQHETIQIMYPHGHTIRECNGILVALSNYEIVFRSLHISSINKNPYVLSRGVYEQFIFHPNPKMTAADTKVIGKIDSTNLFAYTSYCYRLLCI